MPSSPTSMQCFSFLDASPAAATRVLVALACATGLAGCSERTAPAPAPAASAATVTGPASAAPIARAGTDAWLGQWTGPEGTYLRLQGGDGRYDVVIRNLDGERTFRGAADGARIRFDRDGVQETLQASDGNATGMKWLAGKSDCLTVKPGEGYCRG